MRELADRAVRGDLTRSMSAIADIERAPQPPRRLAVGSYGQAMVRGKIDELTTGYGAWEHVTSNT